MKLAAYLAGFLLICSSAQCVEQTIAGLRIGDSATRLHKVFGKRLTMKGGVPVVEFNNSCALQFVMGDEYHPPALRAKIALIWLHRLGSESQLSHACARLLTPRGISLASSPAQVKQAYGRPSKELREGETIILIYEKNDKCWRGSDTYNYKSFGVRWRRNSDVLHEITVDAGTADCLD